MLYKKKLIKSFFLFSLFGLAISTVLFAFLMINMQLSERREQNTEKINFQSNLLQISGQYIVSNLDVLKESYSLSAWANSKQDSNYYFHAIGIQKHLRVVSANFDQLIFNIAITTTSDDDFVILPNTTVSKDTFFAPEEKNISAEQWQAALAHFEVSQTAYVTASYNNDVISEFFCIFPNFSMQDNLVCILSLAPENIVGQYNEIPYFIAPKTENLQNKYIVSDLVFLNEEKASLEKSGFFEHTFEQKNGASSFSNHEFLYVANDLLPFDLIFHQSNHSENSFTILIIILFPFCVFILLMLPFIVFVSKSLYEPVSNVMSELMQAKENNEISSKKSSKIVDEFKVIKEHAQTTNLLHQELSSLEIEKKGILKQSYYRSLLFSIPDTDCPLTADEMQDCYYLILFEYHMKEEAGELTDIERLSEINLIRESLLNAKPADTSLYYINLENPLAVIIANENCLDYAINSIKRSVEILQDKFNFFIIKSEPCHSVMNIHITFNELRHNMEYRYILPQNKILGSSDIHDEDENYYYFPLSIEKQLITNIANGNKHALVIYDRILRQNHFGKNFSDETKKSFNMVLVNSLLRVFHELKQTPEELLGHEFNQQSILDGWQDVNTWSLLRYHISEILDVLNETTPSKETIQFMMEDFIVSHYAEDIMLNDLAEYCKMTPSYCSTLFKQNFGGVTFKVYLNKHRIKVACNYLLTQPELKVTELSTLVGFNSANSFIRAFNKEMGVSPKIYSENSRKLNK